jgi:predicted Zn-ribbon and HTH transcriptional regulator
VEGIINPLAVRDPYRCRVCGNEWVGYDLDEDTEVRCPRCSSSDVAPIRG